MYNVYCILYTVQCILYILYCTMYNVYCIMYNVHCTLYARHTLTQYIMSVQPSKVIIWKTVRHANPMWLKVVIPSLGPSQ